MRNKMRKFIVTSTIALSIFLGSTTSAEASLFPPDLPPRQVKTLIPSDITRDMMYITGEWTTKPVKVSTKKVCYKRVYKKSVRKVCSVVRFR